MANRVSLNGEDDMEKEILLGRLLKMIYISQEKKFDENNPNHVNDWIKNKKRKFKKRIKDMGIEPYINEIKITDAHYPGFYEEDQKVVSIILETNPKKLPEDERINEWVTVVEALERWKYRYCMSAEQYEDMLIEQESYFVFPPLGTERHLKNPNNQERLKRKKEFLKKEGLTSEKRIREKENKLDGMLEDARENLTQYYHLQDYVLGDLDREFLHLIIIERLIESNIFKEEILGFFKKSEQDKKECVENLRKKLLKEMDKELESDEKNSEEEQEEEILKNSYRDIYRYYAEENPPFSEELLRKIERLNGKLKTKLPKEYSPSEHIKNCNDDQYYIKLLRYMLSQIGTIDGILSESGREIKEEILNCIAMVEEELERSYSKYAGKKEFRGECKFEQLFKTLNLIQVEKGIKARVMDQVK